MYNTKYCKIEYLEEKNAIFCTWKQFCKEDDYRNPFRYALEEIHKHNITTWIVDTQWLLNEFMPKMIQSSIDKIIFIIKRDSSLIDEIMGQVASLDEYFEVELVEKIS